MLKVFSIALLLGISSLSMGQNEPPPEEFKTIPDYRFNVGYAWKGQGIRHLELGLNKDLLDYNQEKLRFGLGVRIGTQQNQNVSFTTAHPSIKKNEANVDTLFHENVVSVAGNFYANLEYYILKKLSVGVNLDLLGISTGSNTNGTFVPGDASHQRGYESDNKAKSFPTQANAFSMGNSKGCLNSQLFVRYEPFRRFGIRAGFSYLFQEFSTEQTYGFFDAYRYENNTPAFFIGVTFNRIDEK